VKKERLELHVMIDHFEIKVLNFKQCLEFYSLVLAPLKIENKWSESSAAGFGLISENKTRFLIEESEQVSRTHIAFSSSEKSLVELFHAVGISNGYVCNGVPGLREDYSPNYYAAFLLDPDGNNIEAVIYL